MSESRGKGLLRLKHLREVGEAKAEAMAAERVRFERLSSKDAAPRVVSSFNLFQTPEALAARMAGMFEKWGRTLEPSAGLGRLYRAVRAVNVDAIVMVDVSPDCCRELYAMSEGDGAVELVTGDFLAMGVERLGTFDSVIMNPPFKMGTDVKHVLHAMTLLKSGGRLVSVCANGPKQRAALAGLGRWIDLPEGIFRECGTGVSTAIIVIDKI